MPKLPVGPIKARGRRENWLSVYAPGSPAPCRRMNADGDIIKQYNFTTLHMNLAKHASRNAAFYWYDT